MLLLSLEKAVIICDVKIFAYNLGKIPIKVEVPRYLRYLTLPIKVLWRALAPSHVSGRCWRVKREVKTFD